MSDKPKSIAEALAEVQRKVNEQRAERLNDMIEAVGAPVPARRGEGVTGIALANQGISRENRRDQAYVDSVFGAGKMKAGSAESNLALLAHAKKQQQAAPSLGAQGPNQSGSASPQLPPNATDAEKAKKAEITQQDKERAAGASVADQRAAGENVSGSMRNVATGLDSKNTGNVQADQSRADVASGKDTSTTGKVMNSLTTSLSKDQGPPKAGEFGSKEDMAKEVASTPPSRGIIGGIKDFFSKPSTPAPAPAPAASAPTPPPRPAEAPTPAPAPAPAARPSLRGAIANINGPEESESGPNKGKKKMSESALIDAFLKLQDTNHSNIFEAAKKAKKDWDGDGKIESEKDEVWGSRMKAAKKAGKMEEEAEEIDEASYSAKAARAGKDIGKPGKQFSKISSSAAKRYGSKAAGERVAGAILAKMRAKHGMEEEVAFSDEELAHIASIVEGAGPVDQGKGDQRRLRGQQTSRGIGDTVPNRDLTDEFEYMDEMARGVKAGTKRGSYKNTKSTRGGMSKAEAPSMPDEAPTGVPHVLDQIRHGREDEQGFKTITHPASSPEAPVTKSIHRSELHGFYDQYHNTEKPAAKEKVYGQFLDKHFGDSRTSASTSKAVTTDLSKIEKSNLKGGAGKVSLGGSKLVGGKK